MVNYLLPPDHLLHAAQQVRRGCELPPGPRVREGPGVIHQKNGVLIVSLGGTAQLLIYSHTAWDKNDSHARPLASRRRRGDSRCLVEMASRAGPGWARLHSRLLLL
jgi:hypothetical protein